MSTQTDNEATAATRKSKATRKESTKTVDRLESLTLRLGSKQKAKLVLEREKLERDRGDAKIAIYNHNSGFKPLEEKQLKIASDTITKADEKIEEINKKLRRQDKEQEEIPEEPKETSE